MKKLLTIIAALVLVGCGESQQSAPAPEVKPTEPVAEAVNLEAPKAKAPDISILVAAYEGNIEAVKQHLAAGTDVNAKDEYGFTPIYAAVAGGGDKEIAELLIANGADVNAKLDDGETPLHRAAYEDHKEIVELLIAKGADVNAGVSQQKSTPLHSAVAENHKEVAELLIANGADVDDGWTWEKVQSQRCFNNLKRNSYWNIRN